MRHRMIHDDPRTFVLVFEVGDAVKAEVIAVAEREEVTGAAISGIGAFQEVQLAFFDWEAKEYRDVPVSGQVEVVSLVGNIALREGRPALHAHVAVGHPDGRVQGGHLVDAIVRPTLELVVTETPLHLARSIDDETGLPLIDLSRVPG